MKIKRRKGTKKCVIKRTLKFQDYKDSLNAAKTDGKLKYLEKKEINDDSHKEITKFKQVMLKTQQRF